MSTIADAPEPRVEIHIPTWALLALPLAAFGTYMLLAHRPELPEAPEPEASAVVAPAVVGSDPIGAESDGPKATEAPAATEEDGTANDGATDDGATDDGATDDGATDDGATDALDTAESPLVIAQRIAELERSRERAAQAAQQFEAARRSVRVIMFTTDRCTRCAQARSHLVAQGIFPTERDIDKDPRARKRHDALTRKGALPTIVVDGKVLVGFRPDRLDKAIEKAANKRLERKRKRKR